MEMFGDSFKNKLYRVEKKMENYFIIHGSFGSPFGNWFSWLHDFLETYKQIM